jgi:hypothetical protein
MGRKLTVLQSQVVFYYKTQRCLIEVPHGTGLCFFFHSPEDYRRCPFTPGLDFSYEAKMCEEIDCRDDFCRLCHSRHELSFHPLRYKTRACARSSCKRNPVLCPGVHPGEMVDPIAKLSISMDQFKTQRCELKKPHLWEACFYSHGAKDTRRNPQ